MNLCLFLLSLLIYSIQGNANPEEENISLIDEVKQQGELLKEAKDWFLETINTLREEVQSGINQVRDLSHSLKEDGKSEIQDRYQVSKNQLNLMSLPPDCLNLAQDQLQTLQNSNFQGFLQCPNLTLAAKDVVNIGFEAAKLTAQLLLTADEVINGFGMCVSWNPFHFIWCSFKWIKNSTVQSFRSLKDIKYFMSNVSNLTKDINTQYNYCMNLSKGLADLHTVDVLSQVHKCTLKGNRN